MNHVPVRISTLRPDDVVNFDVYIKVGDRLIHYIRNAEPFDADRLDKLRAKGVKKMFITEEEEQLYLKYLDMGLDRLQDKSMSKEQQASFVRDTMTTEAENAVRNLETKEGYLQTENRIGKIVKFLAGESGALKSVLEATGFASDNFQHCANVSTIALSLANSLGLNKPREQLDLGLAALVHDLGKEKLGLDPHTLRETLSKDQLKQWDKHPEEGAGLLADKPYINATVLEMIKNHEEKGNMLGPNKKVLASLPELTQILCLVNEYDHEASVKQIPPKEVIKTFFEAKLGLYNLKHINALASLLK